MGGNCAVQVVVDIGHRIEQRLGPEEATRQATNAMLDDAEGR